MEYRDKIRLFTETEIKPLAAELDDKEIFSVDLTRKMGEAGLFGIDIPREYGGQGLDTLSYIIAIEEIARVDASQAATVAAHNSLGIAPIYHFGTEAQRLNLVPTLCTGEALWAFALTEERAGSDARGAKTSAREEGNQIIIDGEKRYITNGSNNLLLGYTVLAVTQNDDRKPEFSTYLVEKNLPGVVPERMTGKLMWRASDTARIAFNGVSIPASNLLGEKGNGLKNMLKTLDGGRLSIAAMGLGLAQGAFEMALNYANSREQFGKTLGKNQIIQFKLADMALKIELARNTLYNACRLKQAGLPFTKEAAMSKLYCSEIAKEVADQAVQIFGGAGLFKTADIERFFRDQRILQIGEGTSEILHTVIARNIGVL